jgi:hypothetical protein
MTSSRRAFFAVLCMTWPKREITVIYAVNLNISMAYYASGASMIMPWIPPASEALVCHIQAI